MNKYSEMGQSIEEQSEEIDCIEVLRHLNSIPTQCDRIELYIKTFGSITQLEAIRDLGVMRLASRISEMKKSGMLISSKMETGRNRYGEEIHFKRYFIEEEAK